MKKIFAFLICFSSQVSFSQMERVFLVDIPLDLPNREQIKTSALTKVKEAEKKGDWKSCEKSSQEAFRKYKIVREWILLTWVKCLRGQFNLTPDVKILTPFLMEISKADSQIFTDATRLLFQNEFFKLVDRVSQVRLKYKELGVSNGLLYDAMLPLIEGASKENKARFWFELASLLYSQHKYEMAHFFAQKSYKINESEETLNLLNQVFVALKMDLNQLPRPKNKFVYQSIQEKELLLSFENVSKKKDALAIFQEGLDYLKKFPNGQEADRVEQILLQKYFEVEGGSKNLKDRVIKYLQMAPYPYLDKWARRSHRRGDYQLAHILSKRALEVLITPDMLYIAGRSAFYLGLYAEAEDKFIQYIDTASRGADIEDVFLKLSFSFIRRNELSSALSWLERFLQGNPSSSSALIAKNWWIVIKEVQGQGQAEDTKKVRAELLAQYPLSLYGLLHRSQNQGQSIKIVGSKKETQKKYMLPLTSLEKRKWDKINLLSTRGWKDEAHKEIQTLVWPEIPELKLSLAHTYKNWGLTASLAMTLNDLPISHFDEIPKELFREAYPKLYEEEVIKNSVKNYFDPRLIWSLIRQESGFLSQAQSSANAIGLMQIISPTAKELGIQGGQTIIDWELEGRVVPVNIEMGTRYLKSLVDRFDRSVPLALAAYNYGQGRLATWLKFRPQIKDKILNPKEPFDLLWMDELPTQETSFYVKAILRNMLIYKALESEISLNWTNIWKDLVLSQ